MLSWAEHEKSFITSGPYLYLLKVIKIIKLKLCLTRLHHTADIFFFFFFFFLIFFGIIGSILVTLKIKYRFSQC